MKEPINRQCFIAGWLCTVQFLQSLLRALALAITLFAKKMYCIKAGIAICALYVIIVYFGSYQEWGFDFYSYYVTAAELVSGKNPYHIFFVNNIGRAPHLWMSANPNLPITLLFFSILTHFYYMKAFVIWVIFSGALGLFGVYRVCVCFYPKALTKNSILLICLAYLSAFPVLMNTALGQLGGLLLFLLANGYWFYLQKKEMHAGFWWGLLIALKIFPGLLFVYSMLKKRYRLFFWLLGFSALWTLFPLFFIHAEIYRQYLLNINTNISWYGFNWNASIFGFLFRLLVDVKQQKVVDLATGSVANLIVPNHIQQVFWTKAIFFCIACIALTGFIVFFKRIAGNLKHKDFAFLVVLMLLLSPLGWGYYFPMLLIPLLATMPSAKVNINYFILLFICLLLLYFPMPIIHAIQMKSILAKIGVYSLSFYGLLILAYLTLKINRDPDDKLENDIPLGLPRVLIGLAILGVIFILLRICTLTFIYSYGL